MHDARALDSGREALTDGGDAVGDLFEAAETERRFGELELVTLGGGDPRGVDRPDGGDGVVQVASMMVVIPLHWRRRFRLSERRRWAAQRSMRAWRFSVTQSFRARARWQSWRASSSQRWRKCVVVEDAVDVGAPEMRPFSSVAAVVSPMWIS